MVRQEACDMEPAAEAERHSPLDISVLICGAGVGGLMTALECWRRGCEVRIFERTAHNVTAGDSFTIGPTALNAFNNWPEMAQRNDEIAYKALFRNHSITGERMGEAVDFSEYVFSGLEKEEAPPLVCRHSRPKFHSMLLKQLQKLGISVEYTREVVEYTEEPQGSQATVRLRDGSVYSADLVIAADGIRSTSSSLVLGEPAVARSSGRALFRVAYPVELALADPLVAERFLLTDDGRSIVELWSGADTHAVFWRSEDYMTVVIDHPDHGTAEESWSHRISPEEVLRYTATIPGWPEVGNRVIKTIPPELLMDFRVMWRDPQPMWTSPGGRVIQLGDAAHTFIPSSGDKAKISEATRVHNMLRFERVSCLQAWGLLNRQKQSNTLYGREDVEKSRIFLPKWVIRHDPEHYAVEKYDEALAHLTTGASFSNMNTPPGMVYRSWTIDTLLETYQRREPSVLDGDWS